MQPPDDVAAILAFWFGPDEGVGEVPEEIRRRWFGGGDAMDELCRERFGALVERALTGELDDWADTPRSRLALVLLLDQITRNVFRGTARAFAGDARALELCLDAIRSGLDRELAPHARSFLYMPMQHAEDLEVQRHGVNCFAELALEVPPEWRERFDGFHAFAERHREIIERFGRFPHRNAVLGRESTPEERAELDDSGNPFG